MADNIEVVDKDGNVVRVIETQYDKDSRGFEKVMSGLLRQMNTDEYTARVQGEEQTVNDAVLVPPELSFDVTYWTDEDADTDDGYMIDEVSYHRLVNILADPRIRRYEITRRARE